MSQSTSPSAVMRAAGSFGTAWLAAQAVTAVVVLGALASARLGGDRRERERGDVPGWVLVTLMTAGLVTALWAVAGPQLEQLFTKAVSSVKGPK